MKRRLLSLVLLAASFAGIYAPAQNASEQAWSPVTQAGPVGPVRNYRLYGLAPATYTVAWYNDHTPAIACTYQVEGSLDNVHWHPVSAILSCINYDEKTDGGSSSMFHVISKPVTFLRVNVLTYTAGDSTTAVTFQYARGGQ